jgi:DNA polymerase-3 subunit delta
MIILLFGKDTYRSREKLKEIIEHYKEVHKSGLSLMYFEEELLKFEDFKDKLFQVSMFNEKKLAVLVNVFSNTDFKEDFLKNQKEILGLKDIIIFYEENDVPKGDKLFKLLREKAKVQEFSPLEGVKLRSWIKKEVEGLGAKISPQALGKLIEFVGGNTWQLSNEIKKLVSFKQKKEIEVKDVELLVRAKIETDIFKTIDAIAQKDKKRALSLIHKHLERGDSPLYLLTMINFQFRNLLTVKDLAEKGWPYYRILKAAKLHPFVVKKSYQQAGKFSFLELKKIYQKIFQVDLSIKTGKVLPETALDLLLTGI